MFRVEWIATSANVGTCSSLVAVCLDTALVDDAAVAQPMRVIIKDNRVTANIT